MKLAGFQTTKERTLVRIEEMKRASGIILSEETSPYLVAEVISSTEYSVNQLVLIQKGAGNEIELDGKKFKLIQDSQILGYWRSRL